MNNDIKVEYSTYVWQTTEQIIKFLTYFLKNIFHNAGNLRSNRKVRSLKYKKKLK